MDSSAHDYRIDPDSISEGAARTEGAQPWSSVAFASDSGAITAVAPFSFWGIFRSEDSSGQIWAPPMRCDCRCGQMWPGGNQMWPGGKAIQQPCSFSSADGPPRAGDNLA